MERKEFEVVELDQPIKRGSGDTAKEITEITLRRPQGGDLRGQSLIDISMAKIDAISAVLPRISNPVIHANEIKQMDGADLMDIGLTIAGFFTKAKHQQLIENDESLIA